MDFRPILLGIVILIFIIVLIKVGNITDSTSDNAENLESAPQDYPLYTGLPIDRTWTKPYFAMTDGEKVQYIIDTFYSIQSESAAAEIQRKKEDKYITSLPLADDCADDFNKCAEWAKNGECTINPEWMLYNCKKSCKTCKLNPQELYNVTRIYNSRPPAASVFHGAEYPGNFPFLNYLYDYDNLPQSELGRVTSDPNV